MTLSVVNKGVFIMTANLQITWVAIFLCHTPVFSETDSCPPDAGLFQCADGNCIPVVWRCDRKYDCRDRSDEFFCTSPRTATCAHHQYRCDNGKCIPSSFVCDGAADCPNESDESPEMCTTSSVTDTPSTSIRVTSPTPVTTTAKTMTMTTLATCPGNEFMCAIGSCIPAHWVCDGERDCLFGWDESAYLCSSRLKPPDTTPTTEPTNTCSSVEFQCTNRQCIPTRWRCDEDEDCIDGSDEFDCGAIPPTTATTSSSSAAAAAATTIITTLPPPPTTSYQSPAAAATTTPTTATTTTTTISSSSSTATSPTTATTTTACSGHLCTNGNCILASWVCDGDKDCLDGSDESRDTCPEGPNACGAGELACKSGACYKKKWRCDGQYDCLDGSDEDPEFCGFSSVSTGAISTTTATSSTPTMTHLPPTTSSPSPAATTIAASTPTTTHLPPVLSSLSAAATTIITTLPPPPTTSSYQSPAAAATITTPTTATTTTTTTTISSSSSSSTTTTPTTATTMACTGHLCTNGNCILASWVCDGDKDCPDGSDESRDTCPEGRNACGAGELACKSGACYKKKWRCDGQYDCLDRSDEDPEFCGFTSESTGGIEVFVTDLTGKIHVIHMLPQAVVMTTLSLKEVERPVAIDYDDVTGRLYWSNLIWGDVKKIHTSELDGSKEEIFLQIEQSSTMEGLTIDSRARLLFYTYPGKKRIVSVSLDPPYNSRVVARTKKAKPRGIVAYSRKRLLIWTDWSKDASIDICLYNGRGWSIVTKEIKLPNGVTLDEENEIVYWCDAGLDLVASVKLDGTQRRNIYSAEGTHFFGIFFFENLLYVTDWKAKTVRQIDTSGKEISIIQHVNFLQPSGIIVLRRYYPPKAPLVTFDGIRRVYVDVLISPRDGDISVKDYKIVYHVSGQSENVTRYVAARNNSEVPGTRYRIQALTPLTTYVLTVRARNAAGYGGETIKRFTTPVIDHPSVPKVISPVRSNSTTSYTLEWETPLSGGLDITGFTIKHRQVNAVETDSVMNITHAVGEWLENLLDGDGWTRYELKELRPNSYYEVLVTATNVYGQSGPGRHVFKTSGDANVTAVVNETTMSPSTQTTENSTAISGTTPDSTPVLVPNETDSHCNDDLFACKHGAKTCIPVTWVCDGERDCPYGSDESLVTCPVGQRSCPEGQVPCRDGTCYAVEWHCDGEYDCQDKSDEDPGLCGYTEKQTSTFSTTPSKVICDKNKFLCDKDTCIPRNWVCDGKSQCEDGSDEQPSVCDDAHSDSVLILTQQFPRALTFIDLSGKREAKTVMFPFSWTGYGMLDVDSRNRALYWTNWRNDNIYSGLITESYEIQRIRKLLDVKDVGGFAVDWAHHNLYWNSDKQSSIRVMSLQTMTSTTLLNTTFSKITDIDVDPKYGWVYWAGLDMRGVKVKRCGMDGSRRETLIKRIGQWPPDITIDIDTDRLFLLDKRPSRVFSCNLDGRNCITVVAKRNLVSIDVYRNRLYYVRSEYKVQSVDLNKTDSVQKLTEGDTGHRHMGLKVFAPNRQPKVKSRCGSTNGGCQICLPRPSAKINSGKFKCACPDHLNLQSDGRSCSRNNPIPPVCGEGYTVVTDRCEDIDECGQTPSPCSQVCVNSPGSYQCKCSPGYRLINGTNCTVQASTAFLLVLQRHGMKRVNLTTLSSRAMSFNGHTHHITGPTSLTCNVRDSIVFWADVFKKSISMARFKGFRIYTIHPGTIYQDDQSGISGLAYDWVHHNLYWTDSQRKCIRVMAMQSRYIKTVVNKLRQPRSVSLDLKERWLYWTDWANPSKIERIGLDGSHRSVIINTDIVWPNGITIDYNERRLYWIDAKLDTLSSCDMDGGNRTLVIQLPARLHVHMYGITLFQDHIYWSDWRSNSIGRVTKTSGENLTIINVGRTQPFDITVVHPERQPLEENVCGDYNGDCSHICLPSPALTSDSPKFKCECPDNGNFQLALDRKTCIDGDF